MKMEKDLAAIVLFTLFYYLFKSSYAHNQQMDPKNKIKWDCGRVGLYETCETMESSLGCETTPYCIHCIWNTAFNPKETVDEKCNSCQNAIDQGNVGNQEELVSKLKTGCNIHEKERDKFICTELVQNLATRKSFWDVEKTDVSSLDICSFLGLCFSQFDVKFEYVEPEDWDSITQRGPEISGKNAATAEDATIYRILENGTRMNPSNQSHIPMFKSYSEFYYEPFRSGQFSKYSCNFVLTGNGNVEWGDFFMILAVIIIISSIIIITMCWQISRENSKPEIEDGM